MNQDLKRLQEHLADIANRTKNIFGNQRFFFQIKNHTQLCSFPSEKLYHFEVSMFATKLVTDGLEVNLLHFVEFGEATGWGIPSFEQYDRLYLQGLLKLIDLFETNRICKCPNLVEYLEFSSDGCPMTSYDKKYLENCPN